MGWIDDVAQRCSVDTAIEAVGLSKRRGRSFGPCPSCGSEKRGSSDSRGPVGVRGDSRGWHCFKCGASGDALELLSLVWMGCRVRDLTPEQRSDLRKRVTENQWADEKDSEPRRAKKKKKPEEQKGWAVKALGRGNADPVEPPPDSEGDFAWNKSLPSRCSVQLWEEEGLQTLTYLRGRGFLDETLLHWGIGAHFVYRDGKVVAQFVAIPLKRADGKVIGMKFRSVPGKCLRCGGEGCRQCKGTGEVRKMYLRCKDQKSTLFGINQLNGDTESEVIIAEGELDVLALWQYGFKENVVSGTAGAGTWAPEWLDEIEPYRHFVIAYDSDKAGKEGATKVAKLLGLERCSMANLPCADAAECMEKCVPGLDVREAIEKSKPLLNLSLTRVDDYIGELEELIANPDTLRGMPTGSDKLDQGIGGWPHGLVIITGDTAAGKTSFTTWASLEQSLRGVSVLLTSFEQRPIGTVQKLVRASLGGDFTAYSKEERKKAMDMLGGLPIHLLDHYGELNLKQLIQALDYSVRRMEVQFAVIDHLGFLVRGAEDERRAREDAVRSLALFGVQRKVCVILICHPNNLSVVQQRRVQLGDLKGASAIRQDAHVGLVVERLMPGSAVPHPAAAVYCDKVRNEFGMQGARVTLFYDPEACVYADKWEDTPMGAQGATGGFPVNTQPRQF